MDDNYSSKPDPAETFPVRDVLRATAVCLSLLAAGALSGRVLPAEGFFRVRPGPIRVRFGAPLALEEDGQALTRQALAARAQAAVEALQRPSRG